MKNKHNLLIKISLVNTEGQHELMFRNCMRLLSQHHAIEASVSYHELHPFQTLKILNTTLSITKTDLYCL